MSSHCLCTVLLFLFPIWPSFLAAELEYKAAVVEYHPTRQEDTNLAQYVKALQSLKESVDFVVFPEATLSTRAIELPPLSTKSDCTQSEEDVVQRLGCEAAKLNAFLIINLSERVNGSGNEYVKYNTDVVFDRGGVLVAKYRKWNLFGESGTSKPDKAEQVTFETEFGRFGIFTCFDIMFQKPALELVVQGHVQHIIFPTMWFSEMPFLTALQAQQMFSYGLNVSLLAANANNFAVGSAGSGIFRGLQSPAGLTIASPLDEGQYNIVQESSIPENSWDSLDSLVLKQDNLKYYKSVLLDLNGSGSALEEVCHEGLCCHFNITWNLLTATTDKSYSYRLVAFSGVRTFSHYANGGLDVCALISCVDDQQIQSCAQRFPRLSEVVWNVQFTSIEISTSLASSEDRMQYPNSLLSNLYPISPENTHWSRSVGEATTSVVFRTDVPVDKLHTFAIYGRDFGRDNDPETGTAPRDLAWSLFPLLMLVGWTTILL